MPFVDITEAREVNVRCLLLGRKNTTDSTSKKFTLPTDMSGSASPLISIQRSEIATSEIRSRLESNAAQLDSARHGNQPAGSSPYADIAHDRRARADAIGNDAFRRAMLSLDMAKLDSDLLAIAMRQPTEGICYNLMKGVISTLDGYPGLVHNIVE